MIGFVEPINFVRVYIYYLGNVNFLSIKLCVQMNKRDLCQPESWQYMYRYDLIRVAIDIGHKTFKPIYFEFKTHIL